MRLIDADEVEKYLEPFIDPYELPGALYAISKMPSVDVPERNVGKWEISYSGSTPYKFCCTNCKVHHRGMYNYCPTCGAQMKEGE